MLRKLIIPLICLLAVTVLIIAWVYPKTMPSGTIVIPMSSTGFGENLPNYKYANKDLPWISADDRQAIADEIYTAWAAVKSGVPTAATKKFFDSDVQDLLRDISGMWKTNIKQYNFIIVGIDGLTPKNVRTFQKTFSNAQYVAFVEVPHGTDNTNMNY